MRKAYVPTQLLEIVCLKSIRCLVAIYIGLVLVTQPFFKVDYIFFFFVRHFNIIIPNVRYVLPIYIIDITVQKAITVKKKLQVKTIDVLMVKRNVKTPVDIHLLSLRLVYPPK